MKLLQYNVFLNVKIVSIPYRLNEIEDLEDLLEKIRKFQFLIGSMKWVVLIRMGNKSTFQFLIGSMKCRLNLQKELELVSFNSL